MGTGHAEGVLTGHLEGEPASVQDHFSMLFIWAFHDAEVLGAAWLAWLWGAKHYLHVSRG